MIQEFWLSALEMNGLNQNEIKKSIKVLKIRLKLDFYSQ